MEKRTWDIYSDLLKPYFEKSFDEIHQNIIAFCQFLRSANHLDIDIQAIDSFVGGLFFIFSKNEFIIPVEYIDSYFHHHYTIANLIRLSTYKNSDTALYLLLSQPVENLVKILILYSAYNTLLLDRKALLALNEKGVSFWFCNFLSNFHVALADPAARKQLQYHLHDTTLQLKAISEIKAALFAPTHIDPNKDRAWKSQFNQLIQDNKFLKDIDFKNVPYNKNKIAIISGSWHKNHSIYRNQFHFLKALSEKYELSLFSVEPLESQDNTHLFKERHHLMAKGKIDSSKLEAGHFPLIYFTDVGLNAETTILSNTRLAPIQVTSYGHSVSTFGSKIDYWIGGIKGEQGTSQVDQATIQQRYSETFIGLPGLGITNTIPNYTSKNSLPRTDLFIINCCWCAHKVNEDLIKSLKKILEKSKRQNVIFRVFSCNIGLSFLTFYKIMLEHLGEHVEVLPAISFGKYMEMMEEGQFSLEAFPFGGCNTVVDALWLRQPIVCLEGERWYSRIGTGLLLQAGIDSEKKILLASNVQQFEEYAINLINDDTLLKSARNQILNADLTNTIFDNLESKYFVQAIDDLLSFF